LVGGGDAAARCSAASGDCSGDVVENTVGGGFPRLVAPPHRGACLQRLVGGAAAAGARSAPRTRPGAAGPLVQQETTDRSSRLATERSHPPSLRVGVGDAANDDRREEWTGALWLRHIGGFSSTP